jgi:hypothetical protein
MRGQQRRVQVDRQQLGRTGQFPRARPRATESVLTGREAHPKHLVPAAIPFRNDPIFKPSAPGATWAIRAAACGP